MSIQRLTVFVARTLIQQLWLKFLLLK